MKKQKTFFRVTVYLKNIPKGVLHGFREKAKLVHTFRNITESELVITLTNLYKELDLPIPASVLKKNDNLLKIEYR